MTLLQELNQVKLFLVVNIDKRVVTELFVDVLHKHDSVFHFDEPAGEIISWHEEDKPRLFSDDEAKMINELRDDLYCDYLFEYAMKVTR